ncbi:MAG TPA: DUF3617 domain-containing protein [Allosphingosinicella sp.]|nr:DUF3617 domain-containing protein [Allosphingosinicella sp.]
MRRTIFAGAALLLASCGSEDKGGNGAAETANGAAPANVVVPAPPSPGGGSAPGGTVELRPGQWETTVEILRMDIPNMQGVPIPKQGPVTVRSCLTPEQARRPNGGFMTGARDQNGCNYENFSMAGGHVQGTVICNRQGTAIRSTVNGTFSAEAYRMETEASVRTNGMTVNTANRITGRRIGDCKG